MKKVLKVIIVTLASIIAILVLIGLSIWGYTKYQIESHERFWQAEAAKPIPENALIYVALGDSTAQGIGSPNPLEGYVGQFAKKLTEQTGRPVHIVNLSKTGAIASDVVNNQLPMLKKHNPDIVTVAIGGNDVLADAKQEDLFNTLVLIAEKVPKGTLFADLPTFERGSQKETGIASRKIIQDITEKYNLIYVPINEATEPKFWDIDQYAIDFLHPSVKQYTIWAETFWNAYQQTDPNVANK